MKKIMILIIIALFLAACSSTEPAAPQTTPAVEPEPAVQAAPQPEPAPQEPVLPEDTYKISASDLANPITLKYKIDSDDIGLIKSVTFDIRNFGDKPITPVVLFYVGSESDSTLKRFEYDELPPGYKMIKNEEVNQEVFGLHDVNAIKATLRDKNNNEELIGENQQNYIAKPSYDSS